MDKKLEGLQQDIETLLQQFTNETGQVVLKIDVSNSDVQANNIKVSRVRYAAKVVLKGDIGLPATS